MSPRGTIARKELRDIFKERTILVAVLIQVVVAGLSGFLVVGLSAISDPSAIPSTRQPTVAVAGPDDVVDPMLDTSLNGVRYDSGEAALAAFRTGQADAAVLVTDPGANGTVVRLDLYLPDGDIRATLSLVHVREGLQSYERGLREERADRVEFDPVYVDADVQGSSYEFAYGVLIPLLIFLPVFLAGALTADSLTEEIQRNTLPVLVSSPAKPRDVVEGKLLANAGIAPLLAAVWLGLLALNGWTVPLLGGVLIVALTAGAAVVMGIVAAAVALWTQDRDKAQVLYTQAMLVVIGASLLLPRSPANAVTLLGAGSTDLLSVLVVAGTAATAAVGLVVTRWMLARADTAALWTRDG